MEQHGENVDLERVGPIVAANLGEEEFGGRSRWRSRGSSTFAEAVAAPAGDNQTAVGSRPRAAPPPHRLGPP